MSRKFILSESSYDFKYRNILSNIPNIEVIEGSYFSLLRLFLKKNTYYHIRYIKFRGYIRTFFRLAIIYLIAKISGNKVIWSCHNIYEHNIPSTRYNDIIRDLLCKYADNIIVFHRDILKYLPKRCHHKTTVASFGDFRDFIYSQTDINEKFQEKYTAWLTSLQISQPAVISISAAKRNSLDLLFKVADLHCINVLAIAPNLGKKVNKSNNILFYNDSFVKKEVAEILENSKQLIGFIGHDNISVPTSVYMYASFGIPIIALNFKPTKTIVGDYKIGEVIACSDEFFEAYQKIINNYDEYYLNCKRFITANSWEKSAEAHRKIFDN